MPTNLTERGTAIYGQFVPEVQLTVYPGCRACGGVHPLMRKPIMAEDICPDCDAPLPRVGDTVTVGAVIVGWSPAAIVARICFGASRLLATLIKKV